MYFYKVDSKIVYSTTELDGLTPVKANSTEAAVEKHLPVVSINGTNVDVVVGSTIHPMEEKHYIGFIILETTKGVYQRILKPGDEPKAHFTLNDEELVAVYEHCNLHGIWVTKN